MRTTQALAVFTLTYALTAGLIAGPTLLAYGMLGASDVLPWWGHAILGLNIGVAVGVGVTFAWRTADLVRYR